MTVIPARRRRRTPQLPAFADISDIELHMPVYDRDKQQPAMVHEIQGDKITVIRPAGNTWEVHYTRLSPATFAHRRQLKALAKFQRFRTRGVPP